MQEKINDLKIFVSSNDKFRYAHLVEKLRPKISALIWLNRRNNHENPARCNLLLPNGLRTPIFRIPVTHSKQTRFHTLAKIWGGGAKAPQNETRKSGAATPLSILSLLTAAIEGVRDALRVIGYFEAAARVSAAWPLTRTASQIWAILPSSSIKKVLRTIPLKLRPMNFFMRHCP
jgi:hypothetical protein